MDCTQHDIVCWQNSALVETFQLGGPEATWDLQNATEIKVQNVPLPGLPPMATLLFSTSQIVVVDARARIVRLTAGQQGMLLQPAGTWFYDLLVTDGGTVLKRAEGKFIIKAKRTT